MLRPEATTCSHPVVLWAGQQLRVAAAAKHHKVGGQADADAAVLRQPHCVRCGMDSKCGKGKGLGGGRGST